MSLSRFRHGLCSEQLVIKGEDPAELDALKADFVSEHQPGNLTEEILVNEMAEHYWRLKRFRHAEASLMNAETLVMSQIEAVQRFMNTAERGFHKALKALRELQKARGFVPAKSLDMAAEPKTDHGPQTTNHGYAGFVPSKCVQAEPAGDDQADFDAVFESIEAYVKETESVEQASGRQSRFSNRLTAPISSL
jgi:hypothetical protein